MPPINKYTEIIHNLIYNNNDINSINYVIGNYQALLDNIILKILPNIDISCTPIYKIKFGKIFVIDKLCLSNEYSEIYDLFGTSEIELEKILELIPEEEIIKCILTHI